MTAILAASLTLAWQAAVPGELDAYVSRVDSAFRWKTIGSSTSKLTIELISQRWQGEPWRHELIQVNPRRVEHRGQAILVITGGKSNAADLETARTLAEASGMPVVTLFQIPNQPLWGLNEDALIAHTFEQYFKTGDASWPLLFPMSKAASKALDAVVAATAKSRNPLRRFVVTGASKRGWTTWLVGALADRRVVGIAPMVYDNLDIPAQLKHQIDSWGKYSEMIGDYTERGLPDALNSPPGKKLAAMVDPYSYRSKIKCPTLVVNGANDRYWTVDSLSLYWDALRQPKWATIVPNAGHGLGDGKIAFAAIAAFARACAGEFTMPLFSCSATRTRDGRVEIGWTSSGPRIRELVVWTATSASLDFRDSVWRPSLRVSGTKNFSSGARSKRAIPMPGSRCALMVEARFTIEGRSFSLCSPVRVFHPKP